MTQADTAAQGGLEQVAGPDRVASLTGIRAVAALLVVATHAAYTTGKYIEGYFGLFCSRMEVGVPIFFVLSGFLLFRPWVKSAATGGPEPSVRRYGWHRVRRIMPAYVVTVLIAYLVYHFRTAGPNPGHTWMGLFRNLTLTQVYTDNYLLAPTGLDNLIYPLVQDIIGSLPSSAASVDVAPVTDLVAALDPSAFSAGLADLTAPTAAGLLDPVLEGLLNSGLSLF